MSHPPLHSATPTPLTTPNRARYTVRRSDATQTPPVVSPDLVPLPVLHLQLRYRPDQHPPVTGFEHLDGLAAGSTITLTAESIALPFQMVRQQFFHQVVTIEGQRPQVVSGTTTVTNPITAGALAGVIEQMTRHVQHTMDDQQAVALRELINGGALDQRPLS